MKGLNKLFTGIALLLSFVTLNSNAVDIRLAHSAYTERLSAEEIEKLVKFFNQTREYLPQKIDEQIKLVEVTFTELNSKVHSAQNKYIAGVSKGAQVKLDKKLLDDILTKTGNIKMLPLATLLHEIAHIYDEQFEISSSKQFLALVGFRSVNKYKNHLPMRSPDLYEGTNSREYFAVNFEHFILDPEYSCRRPLQFSFYASLFAAHFKLAQCHPSIIIYNDEKAALQQIDPRKVIGVDYLVASKGEKIFSRFGHSMLRLVICKDLPSMVQVNAELVQKCRGNMQENLVISFRANSHELQLSAWKGIAGKYSSELFFLSFGQVVQEYTEGELRDLFSFPLILNLDQREKLLWAAASAHWEYRGKYKFFTGNCATETRDLLKSVMPESNIINSRAITPKGLLHDLIQARLIDHKRIEPLIKMFDKGSGVNSEELKQIKNEHLLNEGVLPIINKALVVLSEKKIVSHSMTYNQYRKLSIGERIELSHKAIDSVSLSALFFLERKLMIQLNQSLSSKLSHYFHENTKDKNLKNLQEILSYQNKELLFNMGYGLPKQEELADYGAESKKQQQGILATRDIMREKFGKEIEEIQSSAEYSALLLQRLR